MLPFTPAGQDESPRQQLSTKYTVPVFIKYIMNTYATWIAANIKQDCAGTCAEATERMVAAFPELRRIRGHYHCPAQGKRPHWWLITPDGTIIDPTEAQFPSKGCGTYIEHDESQPEPTGICINCGDYSYDGNYYCTDKCSADYINYCSNFLLD